LRERKREAGWEDSLKGHCNVPQSHRDNVKLGSWVMTQRQQYRRQQSGKTSHMMLSRIQALESLGFKWEV
jgi:hypothetical protein